MKETDCPKNQLSKLVCDQLSSEDSDFLMDHLETCLDCQSELESLSAGDEWWNRAKRGLENAEIDEECHLLDSEETICSIDTLIFDQPENQLDDFSNVISEMLDQPSHPEMLGRIDEFDIEKKIGQGGMGIVFRGFDRSLNRPVAIKVMAPRFGANARARQRFEREARAAAAVVHPNVIPIYRVSTTTKDRPYIAMALADGLSLQDYVAIHGPFEVKEVVRIAVQIAGGLAEAHKQGLIHRDIKPANVLMEKDVGRIMITDFGLARAVDDVMMTQSGCLAGTPNYMSPEQAVGKELDQRSDLFSLGSLMYFIATGREPFRAEGAFAVIHKITQDAPESARSLNEAIPEVLNRINERLLEKNPKHRIASAAELELLLTQVLAHLQEPTQHHLPHVKSTTVERRKVYRRIGWGMITTALLAFGWMAWAGYFTPDPAIPSLENNKDTHNLGESNEHAERHDSDSKTERGNAEKSNKHD